MCVEHFRPSHLSKFGDLIIPVVGLSLFSYYLHYSVQLTILSIYFHTLSGWCRVCDHKILRLSLCKLVRPTLCNVMNEEPGIEEFIYCPLDWFLTSKMFQVWMLASFVVEKFLYRKVLLIAGIANCVP